MDVSLLDGFKDAEACGVEMKQRHDDADGGHQFSHHAGEFAKPRFGFVFSYDFIGVFCRLVVDERFNGFRINLWFLLACQSGPSHSCSPFGYARI